MILNIFDHYGNIHTIGIDDNIDLKFIQVSIIDGDEVGTITGIEEIIDWKKLRMMRGMFFKSFDGIKELKQPEKRSMHTLSASYIVSGIDGIKRWNDIAQNIYDMQGKNPENAYNRFKAFCCSGYIGRKGILDDSENIFIR